MRRSIWIAAALVSAAALGNQLTVSRTDKEDAKAHCRAQQGVLVVAETGFACVKTSALLPMDR